MMYAQCVVMCPEHRRSLISNWCFHILKTEELPPIVGLQKVRFAVGQKWCPQNAQVLTPGTWDSVAAHGKGELQLKIELNLEIS